MKRIRIGSPSAEAVKSLRGAGPQARPSQGKVDRIAKLNRLVESTFDRADSLWDESEAIAKELGHGSPADKASVLGMMARSERRASEAHLLYCAAKATHKELEAQILGELGELRSKAVKVLDEERKTHAKPKQVTDADADAKMASEFQEKYKSLKRREYESRLAIEHLEKIAELWTKRSRTLESLLK